MRDIIGGDFGKAVSHSPPDEHRAFHYVICPSLPLVADQPIHPTSLYLPRVNSASPFLCLDRHTTASSYPIRRLFGPSDGRRVVGAHPSSYLHLSNLKCTLTASFLNPILLHPPLPASRRCRVKSVMRLDSTLSVAPATFSSSESLINLSDQINTPTPGPGAS